MRAILLPLDRALDLLLLLPPTSEAVKWLRARIIDTAGGVADVDYRRVIRFEDSAPERPTPWTPKVGERVVTRYGEVGVVERVNTGCRVPGCCAVMTDDGLLGHSVPLRPAEEAR